MFLGLEYRQTFTSKEEQVNKGSRSWAWTVRACLWIGHLAVTRVSISSDGCAFFRMIMKTNVYLKLIKCLLLLLFSSSSPVYGQYSEYDKTMSALNELQNTLNEVKTKSNKESKVVNGFYAFPNCKTCGGSGAITCVPCFGTGYITGYVTYDCSLCTNGRIQCHACKYVLEYEKRKNEFQKMTPEEQRRYLLNEEQRLRMNQEFLDIVQDGIEQRYQLRQQNNSSYYDNKRLKQQKRAGCASCGGTGVDSTPMTSSGMSTWVAHYHSGNGTKCIYCNRLDSHYHDKCSSCNIPAR